MPYKIAIASGKGGTGKTTVAVNLLHSLNNNLTHKVQLVDCDVEEPNDLIFFSGADKSLENKVHQLIPVIDTNKCTFCRKCANYCEFNAITILPNQIFAEVNEGLCHSCGACVIACNDEAIKERQVTIGSINTYNTAIGNGLIEGRLKVGSAMQTMLIKELKKQVHNGNDFVIYDAPPGTSCPVVETVIDADYVILVTEPTPFGFYDMKLMVELLDELKKPFGVVINKAGLGNTEVYDFIKQNEIELLSEIMFDEEYAACYANGNLLNEIPNAVSDCFYELSMKIKERIAQ